MASSFNHNKKRNAALVYEFMVRQMARQMIEKDLAGYRRTYDVARRYFGPTAYLSKELELFDVIRASRGLPEAAARKVLQEVLSHASRLDKRKIEIEKSNLIKEVNYTFGKDFFSKYRVPEYRLLGSLQLLFNSTGSSSLHEKVNMILQMEEAVVRYMTSPVSERTDVDRPQVDRLVLELATKSFQKRYGSALSGGQKKLLECYVRSMVTGDTRKLQSMVDEQVPKIAAALDAGRKLKEFREDTVMSQRLDEARAGLKRLSGPVSSETVQELMLYQKLVEEMANE